MAKQRANESQAQEPAVKSEPAGFGIRAAEVLGTAVEDSKPTGEKTADGEEIHTVEVAVVSTAPLPEGITELTLTIPLGPVPVVNGEFRVRVPQHANVQLRGIQKIGLHRLLAGLQSIGARLSSDGRWIRTNADAVRWLMERFA